MGSLKSISRSLLGARAPAAGPARKASARALALLLGVLSSCALDFAVGDRTFDCPPETSDCIACNADGSCRVPAPVLAPELPQPGPDNPHPPTPPGDPPPDASVPPDPPDASKPPVVPVLPPLTPGEPRSDGGTPEPPVHEAGPPEPPVPEFCPEFQSRSGDTLCLDAERCFSLGSVLSPSLALWLDPTTLPRDGSRVWCDRSGQRHHALLEPEAAELDIGPDARGVSEPLARSFVLDGSSLSLSEGAQPALLAGNFAVLVAAATPIEASDARAFELFESGADSRINLTILPSTGLPTTGKAEGRITTNQTLLVPTPVVTRSSVYDGAFHLYSLYRRSDAQQVLDDVLQLRLNGVLEFRGSSIAIPRALDLSSAAPPRLGSKNGTSTNGSGRVAVVIILRGSVPEDELARLENFLCAALAVCAAPGPPLGTPPPAPTPADAGP